MNASFGKVWRAHSTVSASTSMSWHSCCMCLAKEAAAQAIRENENAYTVWQGARVLQKILAVPRIHVHNLGYYVLLLDRGYASSPEIVRDSCILASTANAAKAIHGDITSVDQVVEAAKIPFSEIGAVQMRLFAENLQKAGYDVPDDFMDNGIVPLRTHGARFAGACGPESCEHGGDGGYDFFGCTRFGGCGSPWRGCARFLTV